MDNNTESEIINRLQRIESLLSEERKPLLMNVPSAANYLGVSPGFLRNLCIKGTIPAGSKTDGIKNRHYMVDVHKVEDFIAKGGYDAVMMRKFKKNR